MRRLHSTSNRSTGPNGGPTTGATLALSEALARSGSSCPCMIVPSSATQSARSSRIFHTRPSLPAGPQHPGHLGYRARRVDPVPGLCHQHGVDRVTGERDLLGSAGQHG